jgi:hypothetical protein
MKDENEDDSLRGIPIPPASRNVVTNIDLPKFFAQIVVTKVVTFLGWGRNKLKVTVSSVGWGGEVATGA